MTSTFAGAYSDSVTGRGAWDSIALCAGLYCDAPVGLCVRNDALSTFAGCRDMGRTSCSKTESTNDLFFYCKRCTEERAKTPGCADEAVIFLPVHPEHEHCSLCDDKFLSRVAKSFIRLSLHREGSPWRRKLHFSMLDMFGNKGDCAGGAGGAAGAAGPETCCSVYQLVPPGLILALGSNPARSEQFLVGLDCLEHMDIVTVPDIPQDEFFYLFHSKGRIVSMVCQHQLYVAEVFLGFFKSPAEALEFAKTVQGWGFAHPSIFWQQDESLVTSKLADNLYVWDNILDRKCPQFDFTVEDICRLGARAVFEAPAIHKSCEKDPVVSLSP